MMGRAGRPQFDDQGVAVILVHEPKKSFYQFLYEPFPVESCLEQLHDHFNAEIVSGTIRHWDAVDFLSWTYYYRASRNPAYYKLETNGGVASYEAVSASLSELVEATVGDLVNAGCVEYE